MHPEVSEVYLKVCQHGRHLSAMIYGDELLFLGVESRRRYVLPRCHELWHRTSEFKCGNPTKKD
jgi:hypothetical protein